MLSSHQCVCMSLTNNLRTTQYIFLKFDMNNTPLIPYKFPSINNTNMAHARISEVGENSVPQSKVLKFGVDKNVWEICDFYLYRFFPPSS